MKSCWYLWLCNKHSYTRFMDIYGISILENVIIWLCIPVVYQKICNTLYLGIDA